VSIIRVLNEKLHNLWHGEANGLTAAALIVGGASVASRLVGVLRDRVLASSFGAGHDLDVYYAAFRVPDLIYSLIILGALSAGFIPVFSEYLETRSKDEAWKLAAQTLSIVGAVMAGVCLVLALTAQWIVPWTVPGFSGEKLEQTILLSRIMFLSPFLLGISAVMGGVLQAMKRFMAFSLAPVFYNLGIIFGALVLAPRYGIAGVAWGVILGAFLHLATQMTVVIKLGLGKLPWPSFRPSGVRRILKLMLPRTLGLGVSQLNLVILLALASALPAGSVAVFNLANNLQSFPVGIFGISYALAAFPLLARAASRNDQTCFAKELISATSKIGFFILPSMAIFFLLRAQIVRMVFGAGEFDWDNTIRTANVLGAFTAALVAQALVPLFARAFYAKQDTKTPLFIALASEACNLALAIWWRGLFGITGLALAFAAASYVNALLLWIYLKKKYGPFDTYALNISILKSMAAAASIIAVGYPVRQLVGSIYPLHTFWQVALQAAAACVAGGGTFLLVAWVLKSKELLDFLDAIKRKVWRKRPKIDGMEEAQGMG